MSTRPLASNFESFNARALTPSQVAKTFVPSAAFEKLAQRRHSLVIGPRGSGKTTLLKMLQPAAIAAWIHPEAESYARRIEFTGVFIPFDRSWRAQLDALGGRSRATYEHTILGSAAFATHTYRAVVTAFMSRAVPKSPHRHFQTVRLSPAAQEELATRLYDCWQMPTGAKSLLGVRASLGNRLLEIGGLGRRVQTLPPEDAQAAIQEIRWLYTSFLDGITAALDAWEVVTEVEEEKWGLLFDELELAPADVKRLLFSSLRSMDPRILFKLALSPFDGDFSSTLRPEDPKPDDDYDPIHLWFSEKRDTVPFCRMLWESMLSEREIPITPPKEAFGRSLFETPPSEWQEESPKTAYALGSRLQRSFKQLEEIDPTFKAFLDDRELESKTLHLIPAEERASEIRKIAPLVAARHFFLRNEGLKTSRGRSRKRLTLYTGWETLCAVSEGNPRWFISLVSPLLASSEKSNLKFAPNKQAQSIEQLATRYRASLRTIPVTSVVARGKTKGLVSILDSLGEYFHNQQISGPFASQPPGSFTVDADASDDLVVAIGQAINAGAAVLVEDSPENLGVENLRKKRLRLCYLLAAYYNIMPRLSRPVALTRILEEMKFESRDPIQLTLA
jgi:hypothetical protein